MNNYQHEADDHLANLHNGELKARTYVLALIIALTGVVFGIFVMLS
jgi:hypothetical protein